MSTDDEYLEPLSKERLLHHKVLEPLPKDAIAELTRIQQLNVSDFTEADVREEIITPIIRILGYAKGTVFSIDREKKINFLNKRLFIDYNVTLWKENFWLIEAKRPNLKQEAFGQKELAQALLYAVHPDINASLLFYATAIRSKFLIEKKPYGSCG